jgi:hypothetical protein
MIEYSLCRFTNGEMHTIVVIQGRKLEKRTWDASCSHSHMERGSKVTRYMYLYTRASSATCPLRSRCLHSPVVRCQICPRSSPGAPIGFGPDMHSETFFLTKSDALLMQ